MGYRRRAQRYRRGIEGVWCGRPCSQVRCRVTHITNPIRPKAPWGLSIIIALLILICSYFSSFNLKRDDRFPELFLVLAWGPVPGWRSHLPLATRVREGATLTGVRNWLFLLKMVPFYCIRNLNVNWIFHQFTSKLFSFK